MADLGAELSALGLVSAEELSMCSSDIFYKTSDAVFGEEPLDGFTDGLVLSGGYIEEAELKTEPSLLIPV